METTQLTPHETSNHTLPDQLLHRMSVNDIKTKIMRNQYGDRYYVLLGQAVSDHGIQCAIDMCFRPITGRVMEWYKTLTIDQRIGLKECCKLIVGVSWEDLGELFTFFERIDILYNKLKIEGFDIK